MCFGTETSQSSTQAEIKVQGFISSVAHIFFEHKLPVSGYLVAWQYYMNTDDDEDRVCTNTSYAAIIRRDGNKYTMIARTLLTPEDSTNAGVRFQFMQNDVIRVLKDDLIAVFTYEGKASPCRQLVSVYHASGSDTLTVSLGVNSFNIDQTRVLPRDGDDGLVKANPALKAYVSGMYVYKQLLVGEKVK